MKPLNLREGLEFELRELICTRRLCQEFARNFPAGPRARAVVRNMMKACRVKARRHVVNLREFRP